MPIPVGVAVSGTQTYGGTPTFSGNDSPPSGVNVDTSGLVCTIAGIKSIGPTTPAGSYTLAPAGCSGVTLSGGNATGYAVVYTTATGDFTVAPAPLTITASSNSMTYGGTAPTITPWLLGLREQRLRRVAHDRSRRARPRPPAPARCWAAPYVSSCGGAVDHQLHHHLRRGLGARSPRPTLTVTASSGPMTYGGTVPSITAELFRTSSTQSPQLR